MTTTPFLTDRFQTAFAYASQHHAEQLRKGTGIPYVAHLMGVAGIVLEMDTGSEDEAIGALLHDVVEDGGGPEALAHVRTTWGEGVADIVEANSDSLTGEEEKAPWRERKQAYLDAIADKAAPALRVSVADKLHNARAILFDYCTHGEALFSRFKTGEGDSIVWYYRSLVEEFAKRADALGPGGNAALDELKRTVDRLEELRGQAVRNG